MKMEKVAKLKVWLGIFSVVSLYGFGFTHEKIPQNNFSDHRVEKITTNSKTVGLPKTSTFLLILVHCEW